MSESEPTGAYLAGIFVYPLKGAAGMSVERWPLDPLGPWLDRRWMIVDQEGTFVSQRSTPALACIDVSLEGSGPEATLHLSVRPSPHLPSRAVQAGTLELSVHPSVADSGAEAERPVNIWDDIVMAVPATRPASLGDEWASAVVGRPCQLVFMPPDARRPLPADPPQETEVSSLTRSDEGPGRVSFADGYPLLVVSEASLAELNRRSPEVIPMNRFRPNLVVGGAMPHEEDTWHRFQVGSLPFRGLKGCARCSVTTVDQATGQRERGEDSGEPLRTLARYRRREGKVWFGQNAVHLAEGHLAVGDSVQVLEVGPAVGAPPPPGHSDKAHPGPSGPPSRQADGDDGAS